MNLMFMLHQHRRQFHRIHLCSACDPKQPELIQALGTQSSWKKFVLFAVKYACAFSMFIMRVGWEFVN